MRGLGVILVAGLSAGCHHAPPTAPPAGTAPPQLPVTTRGVIEPDVSAVPAEPASPPPRPTQYRRLTTAECRTLAIQNAPLAAELDTHPENAAPGHPALHGRSGLAECSQLARGYAADELRNRSAGDALELYYKLAAAEGQFDLVSDAHGVLREQLTAAEKAVAGGLKDRADSDRLRRQLLELESQRAKLEAGITGLNAGLAGVLGLDPADPMPLWPADGLRVSGEVPDPGQAVAAGLHYRPDLNLLRALVACEDSGEFTTAVLGAANPLLGTAEPATPIGSVVARMKKEPTRPERIARRQLLGLMATRERQADAEVRAAVAAMRGNRAAVAAKAAEVRNLLGRVNELEKRAEAGVAGVQAELVAARLDLLKVRGELVQAAADWHVSDVKLRQAMGVLVRE